MSHHPNAPRCQHVRTNGVRCGSPAMRGRAICYYHLKTTAKPPARPRVMPNLEDADAIQLGIARVLHRLENNDIEFRAASLMLYSYKLAMFNLKRTQPQHVRPTDVITVDPVLDNENAAGVSEPLTYDQAAAARIPTPAAITPIAPLPTEEEAAADEVPVKRAPQSAAQHHAAASSAPERENGYTERRLLTPADTSEISGILDRPPGTPISQAEEDRVMQILNQLAAG